MKKLLSYALVTALTVSAIGFVPSGASAAKAPKLAKTKLSIDSGVTKTIKVKNATKTAKVSWKTSNKKVVKITKKVTKGKNVAVTVKGVSKGSATITGTYKKGKSYTKKLTCKVTVKGASVIETTVAPVTTVPASAQPTSGVVVSTATPTPIITAAPTATPTTKPTARPTATPTIKPTATPVPSPDAQIYKTYETISVDGTMDEAWDYVDALSMDNWTPDEEDYTAQTSNAQVKFLWDEDTIYILVTADDSEIDIANDANYYKDSVELFFDENNDKLGWGRSNAFQYRIVCDPTFEEAGSLTDRTDWNGEEIQSAVALTETGYCVEFAIPLTKKKAVNDFTGLELQINDASKGVRNGTWNLFVAPAEGDAIPYEGSEVFGDCQLVVKTEMTPVEIDLSGVVIDPDTGSKSSYDAETNTISCFEINNITLALPEGVSALTGESVDFEIQGVIAGVEGFRVWLVNGYEGNGAAATTSNQEKYVPETGEFTIRGTLTAEADSDGIMVKASSYNTSIEDLKITKIVLYVEKEVIPSKDETGTDESGESGEPEIIPDGADPKESEKQ